MAQLKDIPECTQLILSTTDFQFAESCLTDYWNGKYFNNEKLDGDLEHEIQEALIVLEEDNRMFGFTARQSRLLGLAISYMKEEYKRMYKDIRAEFGSEFVSIYNKASQFLRDNYWPVHVRNFTSVAKDRFDNKENDND